MLRTKEMIIHIDYVCIMGKYVGSFFGDIDGVRNGSICTFMFFMYVYI